jgi:hypothetical protein
MAANGNGKKLATTKSYAVIKSDAAQILSETLAEGENLGYEDLARIKTPAGGGKAWEMPSGDVSKTYEGVLLLRKPVRAYWPTSIDATGGGDPPGCSSLDSITGVGSPGGNCETCPMNAWGSAGEGRRGKACRQITRLFFLLPNSLLPVLYPAPPSAFGLARTYVLRQAAEGNPYYQVVTRVGLESVQNQDGVAYSRPTLTSLGPVGAGEAERLAEYRAGILPMLEGLTLDPEEVV